MEISVQTLIEMVVVVLILKLIVSRWQPPLQESLQAIICIVLGTTTGYFFNPTKEGFIIGIIASGVAFYGGDTRIAYFSNNSFEIENMTNGMMRLQNFGFLFRTSGNLTFTKVK